MELVEGEGGRSVYYRGFVVWQSVGRSVSHFDPSLEIFAICVYVVENTMVMAMVKRNGMAR